jgi:RNA-directed DNA polymerase
LDLTQSENGTLFIREMRQWRKPRTKVRLFVTKAVMRLGVRVQAAVACGITSKGPWRSSKTPGINQALSNAYLKTEGLYLLRDGCFLN